MTDKMEVTFNQVKYILDRGTWYDAKSFLVPPLAVVHQLNGLVQEELAARDREVKSVRELFQLAGEAQKAGQLKRATALVQRILEIVPGNQHAIAKLCSILRENQNPQEVVEITEGVKHSCSLPLLASRLAALLDLQRYETAQKEFAEFFARKVKLEKDDPLWLVYYRLQGEAPHLFPKDRK